MLTEKEMLPPCEDRFSFYRSFKSAISLSIYLVEIKHVQIRNAYIKFRVGTSCLRPHRLRFATGSVNMSCPFCTNMIESGLHFMLKCPSYAALRAKYLPEKYYRNPSTFRLAILMSNTNQDIIIRVATFIYEAFTLRNQLLHVTN